MKMIWNQRKMIMLTQECVTSIIILTLNLTNFPPLLNDPLGSDYGVLLAQLNVRATLLSTTAENREGKRETTRRLHTHNSRSITARLLTSGTGEGKKGILFVLDTVDTLDPSSCTRPSIEFPHLILPTVTP
jgi:hypothetical protein